MQIVLLLYHAGTHLCPSHRKRDLSLFTTGRQRDLEELLASSYNPTIVDYLISPMFLAMETSESGCY